MSVEHGTEGESSERDVEELAARLGEAIADLPAYREYVDARRAVENDADLQERIDEFETLREEFLLARQAGEATNEDLRELQAAQQELHDRPKMAAYLRAQSEVEAKLQELDGIVSEPLALDFGDSASACCKD